MRKSRGFSVIEIIVAMMVFFLIGGTALISFWIFWSAHQMDRDYVQAREEIEYAFQVLGRDFTNISLGMPNNREGNGNFSEAFRGIDEDNSPIMFFMGEDGADWGGPILLRWHPTSNMPEYFDGGRIRHAVTETVNHGGNDVFIGDELIYAAAIPATSLTSSGASVNGSILKVDDAMLSGERDVPINGRQFPFTLIQTNGVTDLVNYTEEGRHAGIINDSLSQRNPRSWVTFPGLALPLRVRGWDTGSNTLQLAVAPNSRKELFGILSGFEEIYLVKAARVFVNSQNQLVQEIYGDDFNDSPAFETAVSSFVRILAENIASVVFMFDPAGRTLTMYVAAMGVSPNPATGAAIVQPPNWPIVSEDANNSLLPDDTLERRIVVGSRTWRVRN